MPGRVHVRLHLRWQNAGEVFESITVTSRDLTSPCQIHLEASELRQSKGASDVCQAIVISKGHHLVIPLPIDLALAFSRIQINAHARADGGRRPLGTGGP